MPIVSLSSNRALIDALHDLTVEPSITQALQLAEHLGCVAGLDADPSGTAHLLDQVIDASLRDGDVLTALGSLHALGRVADDQADTTLRPARRRGRPAPSPTRGLGPRRSGPRPGRGRPAHRPGRLGGFEAMLAQRTLIQWAAWARDPIVDQLEARRVSLSASWRLRIEHTLQAIATSAQPVPAVIDPRAATTV